MLEGVIESARNAGLEIREVSRYVHARRVLDNWSNQDKNDKYLVPNEVVNAMVDCSLYEGKLKRLVDFFLKI